MPLRQTALTQRPLDLEKEEDHLHDKGFRLPDDAAVGELLQSHERQLRRRIELRLSMNPYADFSVDDVLQEAFADACRGIGGLRSDQPEVLAAWLNRIADNRLARFMRDRRRQKRGGGVTQVPATDSSLWQLVDDLSDANAETGSGKYARTEIEAAVCTAIANLPSQQCSIVERFYLKQHSLDEIASDLGTTKSAIRGILYRAKLAMKKELGNSSRWFTKK